MSPLRRETSQISSWKNTHARPDEPVADLLARALAMLAIRLVSLQAALVDMRKVEAVQQMRVALRRLRVLERVFRRYLKSRHLSKIAATARVVARQLGAARDWDVFLDETLPLAMNNETAIFDTRKLQRAAQLKRAESWAYAVATISDADFTVFLIDVMEAAILASWRVGAKKSLLMNVSEFAPRALDRSLKKTKAVATNTRFQTPSDLHRLRLALKKHRYSIQIFRAIYPKEQRRAYMKALSSLQSLLGTVNDAEVGRRLADGAAAGNGDEAMRVAGFVCGYKAAQADAAVRTIDVRLPALMAMDAFWRD